MPYKNVYLPGLDPVTDYHDFRERLQFADVNSKSLQLEVFYKAVFPHVVSVEKVNDEELNKQGIDTKVCFESGNTRFFDEKIRSKDYGDILLEEYSVWRQYPHANGNEVLCNQPLDFEYASRNLIPGWLSGNKKTDYIVYVIKPSRKAYFLPFLLLQRAWRQYYRLWISRYGRKVALNRSYVTTNIPIPTDVLFKALYQMADWPI